MDDVNLLFCVHILPPAQTTDYKTFDTTLCDSVPVFLDAVVYMFLVLYRPFWSTSV